MKYRIDTLHKHGKPVYMISQSINEDGSLTKNMFLGKVFRTRIEAIHAAMDKEKEATK